MSSSSPPPYVVRSGLRPWYLLFAMLLTCFIGVQGLTSGSSALSILRHSTAQADDEPDLVRDPAGARRDFLRSKRSVALPLSVAEVLLSGLLLVGSGLALAGRRGSRSLALQALAANAVLVGLECALLRNDRAAWFADPVALGMIEIGALGFGAVALTRSRTKSYFEAVAARDERHDDDDDEL